MKCTRLNALYYVDFEDYVGKCGNPIQFLEQSILLLGEGIWKILFQNLNFFSLVGIKNLSDGL